MKPGQFTFTDTQRAAIFGAQLNSALYLVAVIAIGYLKHRDAAVIGGIYTLGVCALCYGAQIANMSKPVVLALSLSSIICGGVAGAALLSF